MARRKGGGANTNPPNVAASGNLLGPRQLRLLATVVTVVVVALAHGTAILRGCELLELGDLQVMGLARERSRELSKSARPLRTLMGWLFGTREPLSSLLRLALEASGIRCAHRIASVALHALCSLECLELCLQHSGGLGASLSAVLLLVAVQPLHVMAVAWASSQPALLLTWAMLRCSRAASRHRRFEAAAFALLGLGMEHSNMALAGPPVLVLLHALLGPGMGMGHVTAAVRTATPTIDVIIAVCVADRVFGAVDIRRPISVETQLASVWWYGVHTLWPAPFKKPALRYAEFWAHPQNPLYGELSLKRQSDALSAGVVLTVALARCLWCFSEPRRASWDVLCLSAVAFALLVLVSESSEPADRCAYLPALCVAAPAAAALFAEPHKKKMSIKGTAFVLVCGLTCFLTWATAKRTECWSDTRSLYASVVESSPWDTVSWAALADLQAASGDDATESRRRAGQPLINCETTDATSAAACYESQVSLRPRGSSYYLHLKLEAATWHSRAKFYTAAKASAAEILEYKPRSTAALLELGIANQGLEDYESATAAFLTAIRLDPTSPTGFERLGNMYVQLGDDGAAFSYFAHELRLAPSHAKRFEPYTSMWRVRDLLKNFRESSSSPEEKNLL